MRAPALAAIDPCAPALAGSWKLPRGLAVTLRPDSPGVLSVAHGRLWVTRDGPHGATPDDSGDDVLEPGRSIHLRAGERVVVESWTQQGPSRFAWDPARTSQACALDVTPVRQPLADLRLAALLAVRASASLGRGLLQLAWQAVRGGPRGRRTEAAIG